MFRLYSIVAMYVQVIIWVSGDLIREIKMTMFFKLSSNTEFQKEKKKVTTRNTNAHSYQKAIFENSLCIMVINNCAMSPSSCGSLHPSAFNGNSTRPSLILL